MWVWVWHIKMEAGSSLEVPAAKGGSSTNRALYVVEGTTEIDGRQVPRSKGRPEEIRG